MVALLSVTAMDCLCPGELRQCVALVDQAEKAREVWKTLISTARQPAAGNCI